MLINMIKGVEGIGKKKEDDDNSSACYESQD